MTYDEITCPYCDFCQEDRDKFEAADSGTAVCEECGKAFKWYKEVETNYTTSKMEDDP